MAEAEVSPPRSTATRSSENTPGHGSAGDKLASIVSISFDRLPAPKGAAIHIDAFARALGAAFGQVRDPLQLLTIAGDDYDEDEAGPRDYAPGVAHTPLPVYGRNPIERCLSFRMGLEGWWRGRGPVDVVHFRSIFEGYPIARDRDRYARALIYEVNGLPSIELKYHYPAIHEDPELLGKLRAQEDFCLAAADAIVTPSPVTAGYLAEERGVDPATITVIPNGVWLDRFPYKPPRPWLEALEDPLGPRLIYSGTMTAWQGVRAAIEALALYRRDAPARLTLLGPTRNRQRRALEKLALRLEVLDHITFEEAVPQAELAAHLHAHDIALAPLVSNDRNKTQGCCPLKLIEAMAAGTPVIASDLPCVAALAEPGRQAWLVRPGDAKAIKDGLLEFGRDPKLNLRLSRAARSGIEDGGRWEDAGEALVSLYEALLGRRSSKARKASASFED